MLLKPPLDAPESRPPTNRWSIPSIVQGCSDVGQAGSLKELLEPAALEELQPTTCHDNPRLELLYHRGQDRYSGQVKELAQNFVGLVAVGQVQPCFPMYANHVINIQEDERVARRGGHTRNPEREALRGRVTYFSRIAWPMGSTSSEGQRRVATAVGCRSLRFGPFSPGARQEVEI